MKPLEKLREELDSVDNQMVALLNRRAELALEVRKTKRQENISVYSPSRERQILDRIKNLAKGGAFPIEPLERIFMNIISTSRSLIGDTSVAYQGTEYSLGHAAAVQQFGENVQYCPEASTDDVFVKVERGDVQFGVVPARSSSTGLDARTFDLLVHYDLKIIAEIKIRERLALLSRAGSCSQIKRVYSSAYFFNRSEPWVKANLPSAELVLESDVVGAIRYLDGHDDVAIIAPETMAEPHALTPLARGIETESGIDPRLIVIGQNIPVPTGNDKTSLVCSVRDRAGALREILSPFSERDITMLKIESRPLRERAWEYAFFIDVIGHQTDDALKEAIEDLRALSTSLKVLGSYPIVCDS